MTQQLEKKGHDPYLALRLPSFRSLLIARSCFTIAMQITSVVVGWQVYDLTKDPMALGLTGLFEAIGYIGVAFISGTIVDRGDAKKILQITFSIKLFFIFMLMLFSTHYFSTSNSILYSFYFVLFGIGLCRGFYSPSTFTLLSQVIPKEQTLNAATWSSSVWQLSSIIGPALGGFCYSLKGPFFSYTLAFVILLAGLIFTFFVILPQKEKKLIPVMESFIDRIFGGLKFVLKTKILLWAMSLDMFAVLFGGAVALLPMFASDILKVGPMGLGFLRAAPALGSALMGFMLAYLPPMKWAGRNMLIAVALFGICMIGFSLSQSFLFSFIFLAFSGACDNISVIVRHTILQLNTPDNMRGRVSAVSTIFISSSNEIGAFESGLTAKFMGAVGSVFFGGSMTLLVVLITWLKSKELRQLKFH